MLVLLVLRARRDWERSLEQVETSSELGALTGVNAKALFVIASRPELAATVDGRLDALVK
jgi:hypothetical protein